jgi:DHA3 family tetracycline resistance protein-like MFS transporter
MAASAPILQPLRGRDFRLLWSGTAASLVGDGIFLVALAWEAYSLENTPTALAIVGLAMTLPQVGFLLVGGVVSDRLDRRLVLMAADSVRALTLATFGGLALAGALTLPIIIGLACVYGVATAFYGPAFDALVPSLVPEELLAQANSLDQLVRPVAARLLGPALGGAVIAAAGPSLAFVLDAATFAASVVSVKLIAAPQSTTAAPGDEGSFLSQCGSGFRLIKSQVWLWGTFLSATFAYLLFVGPSEVLLPFLVKNELHASARTLGIVLAVGGAGAVLAALVMSHSPFPRRHMTFIYATWTVATLAVAGYGIATRAWQLALACFVFNALEAAGTIVWITAKQRLVPPSYLGRVSSVDWFVSIGLLPLSYALTAPVAAAIGERTTLVGAGAVGACVTLAFLFLPGMRRHEGVLAAPRSGSTLPLASFPAET